jgi:nucleoside-diphosphate-sugar epimerase
VRALVRRVEAAGVARGCGADIRVADIFDRGALRDALDGCEVCINLATSLPGPSGRGDFAMNDRVRREGVPILIEACHEAGIARLIQQGISWVGAAGDELADETSVYEPKGDDVGARAIRAAQEMEATVRASSLDWLILRGGLFYGPGTGFDDDWFARALEGRLRLPGDGSDFVTLVHIADMATATVAALDAWPSRKALNIADDMPARWRDVLGYVAAIAGAEAPQPGGAVRLPSFRMSNAQARKSLHWAPRYPDYRSGLVR